MSSGAGATLLPVLVACSTAACSLTTDLDALTSEALPSSAGSGGSSVGGSSAGGSPVGGAGGAAVAASSGGAGGAGGMPTIVDCAPSAAGRALLENGGIELGVDAPGDLNWSGYEATVSDEQTYVHSGATAALVCADAGSTRDLFTAFTDVSTPQPLALGQTYTAAACVRSHPNFGSPSSVAVRLRERSSQGDVNVDVDSDHLTEFGDEWYKLEVTLTVSDPTSTLLLFLALGAEPADGSCFILDDAQVVLVE